MSLQHDPSTSHTIQKPAESASEERYREMVENIDEIFYVISLGEKPFTGKVHYVSKHVKDLLGYESDEFYQDPGLWIRIVHPEDASIVNESRGRIISSGQRETLEYRVRHKQTGDYIWLEEKVVPRFGLDKKVVGFEKVARDITDRKKVEQELRLSTERFELAAAATQGAIYDWDLEENQTYWTSGLFEFYGYLPETASAQKGWWEHRIHPEDVETVVGVLKLCLKDGRDMEIEYRFLAADGRYRFVWDRCHMVKNTQGRVVRMVGSMIDITQRKAAEEALRESEDRYHSLMMQSSEGIFIFDPYSMRIQEANPAFLGLCGYSGEELQELDLYQLVSASPASIDYHVQTVLHAGQISISAWQFKRSNGNLLDVEARATLVSYGDSQIVLVNIADLSERKRAQALQSALYRIAEQTAAAQDLQDFYRAIHSIVAELMNTQNFFIALHDPSSDQLSFPYYADEFGFSAPAPRKMDRSLTAYVVRCGQPLLVTPKVIEELVREGEIDINEESSQNWLGVPLRSKDITMGSLVVQSYNNTAKLGEKEKEVLTFVSQHIAAALERKRAEETIRHHAYHDILTLLPNRILFQDRFNQALARAQREEDMLAMLFLDLDRFKTINDTLGHAVGDKLLQSVADRLTRSLRESDTIARLGGDEFMILISGVHNSEDTVVVADKVLRVFEAPFHLEGHELHITTSIGLSLYPVHGADAETLFKNSDIALYRAKESGRNTFQVYSPNMSIRAGEALAMENRLRRALESREFVMQYQPLVSISTGRLIGMEAMIRWQGPDGKLVYPSDFIPLCEDTGLIIPISEWAMYTACKQNYLWQEQGFTPVPVSINISARQFQQQNLVGLVKRILSETGLDPKFLELELTESAMMYNPDLVAEILRKISSTGVRVSIDDFGSGYSSLSYLRKFPINTLKIDQSFVRDCMVDSDDASIVAAIISLGRSLKMRVVAEGVETKDQLEFLRKNHCDVAQGFLFSRSLPAEEFSRWLTPLSAQVDS